MMRRPPGHVAAQRNRLRLRAITLCLFLIGIVDAQQQQQQAPSHDHGPQVARQLHDSDVPRHHPLAAAVLDSNDARAPLLDLEEAPYANPKGDGSRPKSPPEGNAAIAGFSLETTLETPKAQQKDRSTSSASRQRSKYDNILIPNDASAVATLAPEQSVRAPPPPHRASTADGYGLSSPQIARSLEDWDVEDLVILATVDGDLYATDRKEGNILWHTEIEKPVVNITHHRAHVSALDETYMPVDHYIWAVEPTRDGRIYIMSPQGTGSGLVATSLTMKRLVEMSPFNDRHTPIVYIGKKESTMVTLDASTGRVHGWYGSDGPEHFQNYLPESCVRPNDFENTAECPVSGTITLGRTDYVVYISRTDITDGPLIATLKYSEWGPNSFDKDLHQQYQSSMDNQYILSKPDGQVYAVSAEQARRGTYSFNYRLSAPVCRVFDIARPLDAALGSIPELLVLPQPPPPAADEETARLRSSSVFMNETEGGSWYALSGAAYPLVVQAETAKSAAEGWWENNQELDAMQVRQAMIGRHSLQGREQLRSKFGHSLPALPGGEISSGLAEGDPENSSSMPIHPPMPTEPPNVLKTVKELPQAAANSVVDFLRNPVFILALVTLLVMYQKDLRRWYNGKKRSWFFEPLEIKEGATLPETDETKPMVLEPLPPAPEQVETAPAEPPEGSLPAKEAPIRPTDTPVDLKEVRTADTVKDPAVEDGAKDQPKTPPGADEDAGDAGDAEPASGGGDAEGATVPTKKKRSRGQRAGKKHQRGKKNNRAGSVSQPDALAEDSPAVIASNVMHQIGAQPSELQPDLRTVPGNVQEVSGPAFTIGSLEVNEDKQLGTGSNGTIVFAGKFDGRDVAVKRMLIQFYDIASQETRLLRESDDHRNVIRYFAQQQRDAFLYIALELCQASLADIVERPRAHPELAQAGSADMPGVLYQIANGINHLHSLRIVHRDLKPQNILVNMERDGRPRLLVSDFGLCKKLEGGQSSFGATTAHAAGTSGWRAPELLLDDDARDAGTSLVDAHSTHSGSWSIVGSDAPNRRATRAIDIFSLGLVFYYVLSQGSHPFDCGDRYMREVNIRKGNYNLDKLDAYGDSAEEAKDLIMGMLSANPRERPIAEEVMAHPFFWSAKKRLAFLCDVSDHFEKEPRDPPSELLQKLEQHAPYVCQGDFLRKLPKEFIDSLGKQRKYTGSRLLDLLRALRNKRHHYDDMPEALRARIGSLPDGYLSFWTTKFPGLLISCWSIGWSENWIETDRFQEYYLPAGL